VDDDDGRERLAHAAVNGRKRPRTGRRSVALCSGDPRERACTT